VPSVNDSLVVFLHGVGASGAIWRGSLNRCRRSCRRRPSPRGRAGRFDGGVPGGNGSASPESAPTIANSGSAEAREAFDRVVSAALAERGFSGRLDRVAMFASRRARSWRSTPSPAAAWPVAAVVASSGRLPGAADPLPAAAATPVLLLHGEDDAIVPAEESRRAATRLKAAGFASKRASSRARPFDFRRKASKRRGPSSPAR